MTELEQYQYLNENAFLVNVIGGKWQLWGIQKNDHIKGVWFNVETGDYEDPYSSYFTQHTKAVNNE